MNRAQFMEQLKRLLSDISEGERQEALDFYESYFDEAGGENEAAVIRELGSPGKVAAIIKADLQESNDAYAEYTEKGYEDTRTREEGAVPDKYTAVSAGKNARENNGGQRKFGRQRAGGGNGAQDERTEKQSSTGSGRSRAQRGYHAGKKKNSSATILALILLVFLSPLLIGAAGGALGVIITIALLPFLIVFALGAGALGLLIGAVFCLVAGIGLCFSFPASGILTIGIGVLLFAIAIVFVVLLVWVAGTVVPKLLRKFTDFCHNLLHRQKKEA